MRGHYNRNSRNQILISIAIQSRLKLNSFLFFLFQNKCDEHFGLNELDVKPLLDGFMLAISNQRAQNDSVVEIAYNLTLIYEVRCMQESFRNKEDKLSSKFG